MSDFLSRNITLKEFKEFSKDGVNISFTKLSTNDGLNYTIKLPFGYGLPEEIINEVKELAKDFESGGLYYHPNCDILNNIENLINDKIVPIENPKRILI